MKSPFLDYSAFTCAGCDLMVKVSTIAIIFFKPKGIKLPDISQQNMQCHIENGENKYSLRCPQNNQPTQARVF